MKTTTLGRTGLTVTVAGLGTGGHSRIGIAKGQEHAAQIVRAAFDGGVNFFDSSAVYGTEGAFGEGLRGIPRDRYVLSTKFSYKDKSKAGGILDEQGVFASLHNSLRLLNTDCIDIFHIHALVAEDYDMAREALIPALHKAREQGKIRFLGATELFSVDTAHAMFQRALPEDLFDVVMVGYNLLNPSADKTVFPLTRQKGVGTLCMFAVRTALSDPARLKTAVELILGRGQADPALVPLEGTLNFLTEGGAAASVMEAAYRFCRHNPGIDVTLTGTGSLRHLRDNLASLQKEPLPKETLERLRAMFGNADCESGE